MSTAPNAYNVVSRAGLMFSAARKHYLKNMIIAAFGLLAVMAYVLSPNWINFNPAALFGGNFPGGAVTGDVTAGNEPAQSELAAPQGFTAPEGFAPPEGFTAPAAGDQPAPEGGFTLPEGFTPPEGVDLPEGFTPPMGAGGIGNGFTLPTQIAIPIAGVLAIGLAGLSAWRPRFNRLATTLTAIGGLAAGVAFYGLTFAQDAVLPFDLVSMATLPFWISLFACMGLFIQVFIPRPVEEDSDDSSIREVVAQPRKGGMSVAQNLRVAVDALLANKLRSGLTMLGIVIGVGSVVALMSVGRGAQASITEQISSTGLNLLTISPGSGGFGPGGGNGGGSAETLTYNDAEAILEQIDGITTVLPQYTGNALQVRSDAESTSASVLGSTADYAEARNIDVEIGRYYSQADYSEARRVAVLGQGAAETLFGGLNPIGRDIRIEGKRFEVVGVLAEQDGGFGSDPNQQIHIPLTTGYRQLFDARKAGTTQNTVSSIIVAVENLDDVDAITADIEALLREQHRLDADEDSDFSIVDQQSLLDTAGTITGILTVLLGAIASISLLVGGIGIMNIMLVSVTERTKEIGLRKAIGARRSHILQQFLIETIFLSVLGGLIGVAFGVGIALIVNASGVLDAAVTADSIALGLGFSALVGIFFGVYPANQAASLQPIEALRYE